MKIPQEIIGENKLRDFVIINDYISGLTLEEIKEARNLSISVRRLEQIIYANRAYVNERIAWPKSVRIHKLQRWIKDKPKSNRDPAELLNQLRVEVEGDKPLVDLSQHAYVTIFRNPKSIEERERVIS